MNLQDRVPSLELCRQWKEAGGRQDTEFFFVPKWDGSYEILGKKYCLESTERYVAAPLEGEMMEWLPAEFDVKGLGIVGLTIHKGFCQYLISYENEDYIDWELYDKSLANALMQMCLWYQNERRNP